MGGSGKSRWKISFYRSSPSSPRPQKKPPSEFLCPISASLMADPVIVSSGQTFERACAQACKDLSFTPLLPDGSRPDISSLIPNLALRSTILNWCDLSGFHRPISLLPDAAMELVRALMEAEKDYKKTQEELEEIQEKESKKSQKAIDGKQNNNKTQKGIEEKGKEKENEKTQKGIEEKEREKELLLKGVSENPQWKLSYAATEVNPRHKHLYSSSSSNEEESVVVTPLPLATKPSCYSSSPSTSSATASPAPNSTQNEGKEEEEIVGELKSSLISEQEEALIRLRSISRSSPEKRVPLCTPRLLAALRSLLSSRYSSVQTNAVAVIVNLSLEKPNKVKIVRSGAVPALIDALQSGFLEAQEHAAGALFSLALEDENKTAIGVLGALPPLLHMLRSTSEQGRQDAALALYHLTLVQSNRSKLIKSGAITVLLSLARESDLASRMLIILCNLASGAEGRVALLDAGAVEVFVELLKRKSLDSVVRENCIAALFALSLSSLRFKGAANAAGAVEILMQVGERGSERAWQKVKRMLMLLKEKEGIEDGEEGEHRTGGDDWERDSDLGIGVYRQQQRYQLHKVKNITGAYSTEF